MPTEFVLKNSKINIENILEKNKWDKAIIKPAVSAAAHKTYQVSRNKTKNNVNESQAIVENLSKENDILIQKFADEVKTLGEWSLIFFNKKYSHSVLKFPLENDFRVQEEFGGRYTYEEAPPELIEQAQKIVDFVKDELLYARVDGFYSGGVFCLMELELIEPELFLDTPDAQHNFAEAMLQKILQHVLSS